MSDNVQLKNKTIKESYYRVKYSGFKLDACIYNYVICP